MQVVPSLLDLSSGSRLHKLSRRETTANDGSLPLYSTTVHACEAKITAIAAEGNAAYVAAAKRAYASVNAHKIRTRHVYPFPHCTRQDRCGTPVSKKDQTRFNRYSLTLRRQIF